MKKRVLYLVEIYVAMVAVFVVAKPLFMLYNAAGHHFFVGDVFSVVWHGLSLDISTSIYFALLPYLAVMISLWWKGWGIMRLIMKWYYGIVAVIFSLALVADASLYTFWGFKLDSSVFQYIDSTGDAFVSVSAGYLIVRIILIILISY